LQTAGNYGNQNAEMLQIKPTSFVKDEYKRHESWEGAMSSMRSFAELSLVLWLLAQSQAVSLASWISFGHSATELLSNSPP